MDVFSARLPLGMRAIVCAMHYLPSSSGRSQFKCTDSEQLRSNSRFHRGIAHRLMYLYSVYLLGEI